MAIGDVFDTGRTDDRGHPSALIDADRVKGTPVYNGADEKLGTIDSIMIDKRSGEVAYAVMSFGGFLGIGEQYHPLPWDVLDYDVDVGGYRVHLDRNSLEGAPAYGREEISEFDYDGQGTVIDNYYGDEGRGGRRANNAPDRTNMARRRANPNVDENGQGFFSPEAQANRNGDADHLAEATGHGGDDNTRNRF